MERLGWHFDFHSHESVRIGHKPDFAGAAAALKDAGVDEVITFAKCHNGFSYFPTRVATPHPLMKADILGGMVKALRKEGIRVFAYVSFGIDGEAARKHPEWAQIFAAPVELSPDWFISVCPFTGYTDELMLPHIDEIARKYRPDGFWFDTMGALGACYCAVCRQAFREAHGAEIPRTEDDPNWPAYGAFRRTRGLALLERVGAFIHERLPGAMVGFNQIGSAPYPEKMPPDVTRLTLDPSTSGHQSRAMGFCAVYGSNTDRPAEVMPTIFNQGWGDWTLSTPARMEKVAVACWARKVRLIMGDRLRPEGRLDAATLEALKTFKDLRQRLAPLFPPDASRPDDDIAVVHSKSVVYGEDLRHFAIDPRAHLGPLEGAHQILLDAGASFTIVGDAFLSARLAGTGLVILPELPAIEPEAHAALKAYVKKGGKLLVVGGIPDVAGKPMDWLGVSRAAEPWQDHIWLPAWPTMAHRLPVLVRGAFHKLSLRGAKSAAYAIKPYDLAHGVKFGWGIGPASDRPSEYPALTRRTFGKGEVWYLEAPLFSDHHAGGNWQQIEWMNGLIDALLPGARSRLRWTAGNVELVTRRTDDATWAVLINHGGEEQFTLARPWSRALSPLPAYPVTVELRDGRVPARVTCNGAECRFERRGDLLAVPVIMDAVWKVVRVDWA